MKLLISVRWFHQDMKGGGTDRAATVSVWCPALVVYSFPGHLIFFSPHPIIIKFSLKTFLNFSLVSTWLMFPLVSIFSSLPGCCGHCSAVTQALPELLLENLTTDLSSELSPSWSVIPLQNVCWLCLTRVQCLEAWLARNVLPERPSTVIISFWICFLRWSFLQGDFLFLMAWKVSGHLDFKHHYSGGLGLCLWLFQNGIYLILELQSLTLCKSCPHYHWPVWNNGKSSLSYPKSFLSLLSDMWCHSNILF